MVNIGKNVILTRQFIIGYRMRYIAMPYIAFYTKR